MKNRINVAIIIILFTLFVAMFGFGSPDDNPHGEISQDCQDCHTSKSWKHLASPMKFDHDQTGFRLDGSHAKAECAGCHKDLVFSHVGTACADCHADHHLGQFGNECQNCHTARDWQPRKDLIELHIQRGFPLTGVHAVADCESCHRNGDREEFAGTPTDCQSCHRDALARANDPDHLQVAFSTDCQNCHRAAFGSWNQSTYIHPAAFPLTGAHKNLFCSRCHAITFAGTPANCHDCHQADYESTTNPNHLQSNLATACQDCHSTASWIPALFDHSQTSFPLVGRHIGISCMSCHATQYTGTPSSCYACHQPDYEATTDPDHLAAAFSTDCATCHTPAGWNNTSWNHDGAYFPIYSGVHQGKWNTCNQCHTVSTNFAEFDCTTCHEHNQTSMDDHHSSVQNYQYLSSACYNCHPNGRKP